MARGANDAPGGRSASSKVSGPFLAHGNVAGIGEALHGIGARLPTWRGQNEQTMAHAARAYAKTMKRRKAMAVTSSWSGPGCAARHGHGGGALRMSTVCRQFC